MTDAALAQAPATPLIPDLLPRCDAAAAAAAGLVDAGRAPGSRPGSRPAAASRTPRSRPTRPPRTASPGWRPTPRRCASSPPGPAPSTPTAASARPERLILQIGTGEYLAQLAGGIPMSQNEIVRPHDLGLGEPELAALRTPDLAALIAHGNSDAARARLVALIEATAGAASFGATGLDDDYEMIRDQFRRFADERVVPFAHELAPEGRADPARDRRGDGRARRLRPDHPRGVRRRRPLQDRDVRRLRGALAAATSASARSAPAPRSPPS